jgi:transcription elongation factor Elf1
MAGTKNDIENRGASLFVYCPTCGEKMHVVVRISPEGKGKYISCESCTFSTKYYKGMYTQFSHKFGKK